MNARYFKENLKHLLFVGALLLYFLTAKVFADPSEILTVPVRIPFSAQVRGSVSEFKLRVTEALNHSFVLDLGFQKDNIEAQRRIQRLAGDGARRADGSPNDTGLPIPVKLSIWQANVSETHLIYQRDFADEELIAFGKTEYRKLLAYIPFVPGIYQVRIEAMADVSELQGVPIVFAIYIHRH